MPQTSAIVALNDTLRVSDHNEIVADLAELYSLMLSTTTTMTYVGRRVTQIDWAGSRVVITYTGNRVNTISYHVVAGTPTYTWTMVYTNRKITSITRA
jgi:hypothetical protein